MRWVRTFNVYHFHEMGITKRKGGCESLLWASYTPFRLADDGADVDQTSIAGYWTCRIAARESLILCARCELPLMRATAPVLSALGDMDCRETQTLVLDGNDIPVLLQGVIQSSSH
jgi:hypothetical protein